MLIMMPPPSQPSSQVTLQPLGSNQAQTAAANITLIQNGSIGSLKRSNSSPVPNKNGGSPSKKAAASSSKKKPAKGGSNEAQTTNANVQQSTGALTIAHLINNNHNTNANNISSQATTPNSSTSASPISNIALLMSPSSANAVSSSSPGSGGSSNGSTGGGGNSHSTNHLANDPNAPKPPLTGYQHYFKLRQQELRNQDSSLKFGDIVKIVGNEWSKNMDKDMKNVIGIILS